jgi:hypothetical protein
MPEDTRWLDIEPTPKEKELPAEDNPRRRQLIDALFALPAKQQAFISQLHECQLDERAARKSTGVSQRELSRWKTEAAFARVVGLLQGVAVDDIGLSRAGILSRQLALADDTRRVVTREDARGNAIDEPVDASAARSTLRDLAQELGLLNEPEQSRPRVRIINMSSRRDGDHTVDAIEVQS